MATRVVCAAVVAIATEVNGSWGSHIPCILNTMRRSILIKSDNKAAHEHGYPFEKHHPWFAFVFLFEHQKWKQKADEEDAELATTRRARHLRRVAALLGAFLVSRVHVSWLVLLY